jgi:SAM-dependent methyltransferase
MTSNDSPEKSDRNGPGTDASPDDHNRDAQSERLDPQAEAPGSADPASDYNQLPYPSMPITASPPARLAALATLFGIDPPDVGNARVLELGCAAGGNIIPLAARFPRATFRGIDLSRRQIDDGRARISALGLENIALEQGDLTTLDVAGQQFDYVICHGVFSWVPREAQDAIFRICRQSLAPNGVVAISYNVLPGWHLRTAIRDLCLYYAGPDGPPMARVARARAALQRIAEASEANELYGMLLRTEAKRLKDVPSAYILGEFLSPSNAPCHVREFIERAGAAELEYLCEADLSAALPPALDPAIRERVASVATTDRAAAEQHIDFLTGRLFRNSVLIRRQPGGRPRSEPDPDRLRALHIASSIRLDTNQSTPELGVFTDPAGRPVSTRDNAVREAFTRLANAWPATLTLNQLVGGAEAEVEARLARAILTIVRAGRANVSTVPVRVGAAAQERPKVWAFARAEAATSQPWLTSLNHVGVLAPSLPRMLVPYLDGSLDRPALREWLVAALRGGSIQMPDLPSANGPPSPEQFAATAEDYLEQALSYLARQALLEPEPEIGGSSVPN